jgi:aspartate/methionine/tyrosine aminotransferase
VIVINSFSKSWSMTGWRLGWITAPPDLLFPLAKLTEYNISGPTTFVQHAGITALEACDEHVEQRRTDYAARREIACAGLAAIEGVRVGWPDGAFYVFFAVDGEADSMALAKRILAETGVGLAPGIAFGAEGEGFLRACFARRPEGLREAVGRLADFFARRGVAVSD